MQVFTNTSGIKMNATKSMIGHCLGAAGGMEAIATIQAIRTGWVHPTINHVSAALVSFAGTAALCGSGGHRERNRTGSLVHPAINHVAARHGGVLVQQDFVRCALCYCPNSISSPSSTVEQLYRQAMSHWLGSGRVAPGQGHWQTCSAP